MPVSIKVTADLAPLLSPLTGRGREDAMERLAREVEADVRPYVKRDTGSLEDSAATYSDFRSGRIVWSAQGPGGEYAGHAYETEGVGRHTGQNPKATARWAEAAKRELLESWRRLASEAFSGGAS